jgi:hypothetical protein
MYSERENDGGADMKHCLLFACCLQALSGTIYADISATEADCVLFEHTDRQGSLWTAQADGKDPSSPKLTAWWQDRASSVWVRPGFVLEAYREPDFQGGRIDLSSELPNAMPAAEGYAINLEDMNFNDELSSYRCRPGGEHRLLERGSVLWLDGAKYSWISGGNHPNHKSVEMAVENGDMIVRVHADHTYGTNRQDFVINLSRSLVSAKFSVDGYAEGQADFDLTLAAARPDFRLMLKEIMENIQTVAEGYKSYPPIVEPPKPELQSLIVYLKTYTR